MKLIQFFFGLLLSGSVWSQANAQPLIIAQDIVANATTHRQAPYTILAYNQIEPRALAHYQAGQAITLQAGFVAQAGSVFEATVGKGSLINAEPGLSVRALGNPVVGSVAQVEIRGVTGQAVNLRLVDGQGRLVYEQRLEPADQVALIPIPLGQSRGPLLLGVSTLNQRRSLKLLRP